MGIESVAVHSEPDAEAPFVHEADQSLCIGPAKATESYLNMERILKAAADSQSQAIHPGYGFLSENALFAQLVMQARLGWIGPPPSVIRTMGEKASAKAAAKAVGLPVVPGSEGLLENLEEALQLAEQMGYPVLLKADAGGGGRGMRRANSADELRLAWSAARREAAAAFGNDAMYLEKFLGSARHIEFQVLADRWGNAVHLFERECSIQRRHQKLLEEAPSTALSDERRAEMGALVARAAEQLGYQGAGTVEFLLDGASDELYFIEMNTRLQVEHPVTEMITGIDLVQAQIRIAAGERLWFSQEDLKIDGHAIELRLNAEDPDQGFRPSPGDIERFHIPQPSQGRLRIDAAVDEGSAVSPYYDSMIAKIIGWGSDRSVAIQTCSEALSGMDLQGVPTTASLHQDVLAAPEFAAGKLQVGVIPGRPELNEVAARKEGS
tara:strand:- start:1994 stop:3307 length:1314 start_codon:yes stop_codon:yes gene_type:complete